MQRKDIHYGTLNNRCWLQSTTTLNLSHSLDKSVKSLNWPVCHLDWKERSYNFNILPTKDFTLRSKWHTMRLLTLRSRINFLKHLLLVTVKLIDSFAYYKLVNHFGCQINCKSKEYFFLCFLSVNHWNKYSVPPIKI